MMHERVRERPVLAPAARMDRQPGGLVEDQERVVLMQDRQRAVFRNELRRLRRGRIHDERLAPRDLHFPRERTSVDEHPSRFDPSRDHRAGMLGELLGERLVEPKPGSRRGQDDRATAGRRRRGDRHGGRWPGHPGRFLPGASGLLYLYPGSRAGPASRRPRSPRAYALPGRADPVSEDPG